MKQLIINLTIIVLICLTLTGCKNKEKEEYAVLAQEYRIGFAFCVSASCELSSHRWYNYDKEIKSLDVSATYFLNKAWALSQKAEETEEENKALFAVSANTIDYDLKMLGIDGLLAKYTPLFVKLHKI